MTRCGRANLKSSVYNPTGQSYFDQLSTYNSMTSHIRRVLLAKSVIDNKNERYIRAKQRHESKIGTNKRILQESPPSDIIDRLAYDTQHHPIDILRSNCTVDGMYSQRCQNPCYKETNMFLRDYRDCKELKSHTRSPCRRGECCNCEKYNKRLSRCKQIKFSGTKDATEKFFNLSRNRDQSPCTSGCECASDDTATNKIPDNYAFINSNSQPSDDESNDFKVTHANYLQSNAEKEEARYAQFVYEITQDIVRKELYTDTEFQEVFKKHLDRYSGVLDKHRMLYEIHQLKISLNVDEEEDDEESEDMTNYIYGHRFRAISKPKPPTPPKVLDDNKVVEKLNNYQKLLEQCQKSRKASSRYKSVVLVDANPEILVTERDILQTLMETNMSPAQAERICRSLFHKSKDMTLSQMVTQSILEQNLNVSKMEKQQALTASKCFKNEKNYQTAESMDDNVKQKPERENIKRMEIKKEATKSTAKNFDEFSEKSDNTGFDFKKCTVFGQNIDEETIRIRSTFHKIRDLKEIEKDNGTVKQYELTNEIKIIDEDKKEEQQDEDILTEDEESDPMTYSKDFHDMTQSEQIDSETIKEVIEEQEDLEEKEKGDKSNMEVLNKHKSVQISKCADDLKDSISEVISAKEDDSLTIESNNKIEEKSESEISECV